LLNEKIILPCGISIKNRIVKSAMSEALADEQACPDVRLERLYQTWAEGGAGIIITGNVMVDHRALGEYGNVILEKENKCLAHFKVWAKAGTKNNTQLWMQLNHPGKQSPNFLSKVPVAPSAITYPAPMSNLFNTPRALEENEILEIIERFANAASIAKEVGFSGVQIHGAHGYLISQFLSSLHNVRKDKWGGSLENRSRFVKEIFLAIRKEVGPNFPIGIKLNSADFQKGGFTEKESMEVVTMLDQLGVDLIEISGGTYEAPKMMVGKQKESTKKREAYFMDYCLKVRKLINVPLLLTGGFRTAEGMNLALNENACDMIGIARALALDPDFPNKLLTGKPAISKVKPLSTGIKLLDKIIPLEITWYSQQLHRMGRGKNPRPNASTLISLFKTLTEHGIRGIKKVRS
jgi:2,4-dienoyl-CoA reductase-like NADH-dependent reductase (Old Yellow Enzyme family)